MGTRCRWWVVGLGGGLLWLAACAGGPQPYTYQPENELKPGPGLFTGEEGMWTIVGPSQAPAPQTPADEKAKAASEVGPEGAADPTAPRTVPE